MTWLRMVVWLVLALAMVGTELRWGKRRAEARSDARLTDDLMILTTLLALLAGPLVAVASGGFGQAGAWSIVAGGLICCAGLWLRTAAMRHLGRHYTLTPTVRDDHVLVDDGPYRWVRHPGYSAIILQVLGLTLATGALPALLFVLPLVFLLPLRIRIEESLLAEEFGPAFTEYCRQTPHRIIAGVL